jgi:hypothetical protein
LLLSPSGLSQRFEIVRHKFHDELFVSWMTPPIAVEAIDERLTVMVNFH